MRFSQFLRGASCLAVFTGILGAQAVVVLPGAQSGSTSIPVFNANPLSPQTSITLAPSQSGAYQLLAKPDGSKYYLLTNAVGLAVLDRNLRNPTQILTDTNASVSKAAFSPDGRRLFVIAGNLAYFLDTATDAKLGGGFSIALTGTPQDVAFTIDSQTAFVLSSGSFTAYLTPVSMANGVVGTPLQIPIAGTATGIATAPNGLLYVSAPNGLFEINSNSLTLTRGADTSQTATIPAANTRPGKVQFTSDGQYAVALNSTNAGPAVIFNIANKSSLIVSGANLNGSTLDQLNVGAGDRIYVRSTQNVLYQLSLGGGVSPSPVINALPSGSLIQSIAVSNENPARTLYVNAVSGGANTLYQIDIASNSLTAQQPIPTGNGQILVYTGLSPTSGGSTLALFNTNQTISAGGITLPLVAQVLDATGRPVFGALVNFTVQSGGVTLSASSANTNSGGYAQVYATGGTTPGTATVQASVAGIGSSAAAFTITIQGGATGCTQNCSVAGIGIVSGNGQIISEQATASQLLLVVVKDANGNPLANQQVTFTITQGQGTVACTTIGDQFTSAPTGACAATTDNTTGLTNGVVAITDNNGLAAVKYLATSIFGQSFAQTTVNAATSAGSVNFIVTTVLVARAANAGQAALPAAYVLAPSPGGTAGCPTSIAGFRQICGSAGQTIPGAIQVQVVAVDGPQAGNAIPNVALNVSGTDDPKKAPSASCAGGTPLTDANGIATCDVVLGPVLTNPGSFAALNVNVGGAIQTSLITVVVTQGQASKLNITQGNNSSGRAGAQFTLKAQVTDAANNGVANVPVTWAVTQGSATLSQSSQQSDSGGNVQSVITLGGNPGTVQVKVTANPGGANPLTATFTLTVNVSIGGIAPVSGGGQSAAANQPFGAPLIVKVTDTNGQPLAGATVSFVVTGGSGSVGSPTASTDGGGQASTTVNAGGAPGTLTITATSGTQSTQFTLTVRAPGPAITVANFGNAAGGLTPGLSPCGIAILSGPQGIGLTTSIQGTIAGEPFVGMLPYILSGITISVNGIPAPIYWVSNTTAGGEAVAFQTPCEVTPGTATVVVTVNGGNTNVGSVPVSKYQPGIFSNVINGQRFAVLQHVSDGSFVTADNPARRGEALNMFVTGLGLGTPPTGTNRAGTGNQFSDAIITVGVNNGGVKTIGSQYLPGVIGLYVVTFQVPSDTQTGPVQPLGFVLTDPNDATNTPIYALGAFLPIV